MSEYVKLEDLNIYQVAVVLSDFGWKIYEPLDWKMQKIMGDQFIRSVDSVAANIAEGYGRYHYLDRIRFYYTARASLLEAIHWARLLGKRKVISNEQCLEFVKQANNVHYQLNNWISTTYKSKGK